MPCWKAWAAQERFHSDAISHMGEPALRGSLEKLAHQQAERVEAALLRSQPSKNKADEDLPSYYIALNVSEE